jgi:CheY-like chemotaxis protein
VRHLLEPTGALVREAANGKLALLELAEHPFDLVLLDMHMPVMDGPATIARIRDAGEHWRAVPVIALTADAMAGDRERYLAMGMNGYVSKPVDLRELLNEAVRVLAGAALEEGRLERKPRSRFEIDLPAGGDELETLFTQVPPTFVGADAEPSPPPTEEEGFAAAMEAIKPEWLASVVSDLKRLTEQLSRKEAALVESEALHRAAHDWKGQARLFGYGMAGLIASDLSDRLRDRTGVLEGPERIAALRYLTALSMILARGMDGDGGAACDEIRNKLAA